MRARSGAYGLLLGITMLLLGCRSRPPFVVLGIEDPSGAAAGFATLRVGTARDSLVTVSLSKSVFPLSLTVTAKKTGDKTLWAEARDSSGAPLARGTVQARFASSGTPTAAVQLVKACDTDAQCDDGLFCTGSETCANGMCASGSPACQSNFPCIAETCDEAARSCDFAVSHALCDPGTACTLKFGCIPCSPLACQAEEWCDIVTTDTRYGECLFCDMPAHCGPSCVACSGETPLCGGSPLGCVCDTNPPPRGSCPPGTFCNGTSCQASDTALHCGQDGVACTGATPICGGLEVGCIVDPATGCAGQPDFTPCRVPSPNRAYNICVGGLCVEPGCGDQSCNPPGPSFAQADATPAWQYPDTSQRLCYDTGTTSSCPIPASGQDCASTPLCGQDAQYGWDFTHDPAARYSRTEEVAGEPIVFDNVTDLAWQGCTAGLTGSHCDTGGTFINGWAESLAYCDSLVWGGYADWRLPDIFELQSIVDSDKSDAAVDATYFPNTLSVPFWTSSVTAFASASSWCVEFFAGVSIYLPNASGFSVHGRCVRNAMSRPAPVVGSTGTPRFSVSGSIGQPVVVDGRSGLTWQGCAASAGDCSVSAVHYDWPSALAYCERLSWGGYGSGWRLPNRSEILSIVDVDRGDPAIDSVFSSLQTDPSCLSAPSPACLSYPFWTATSSANAPANAWSLDFSTGTPSGWPKTDSSSVYVRCVR